ncbi:MAG: hypothetical protein KME26_06055 [Oscillatoria princeps RMCB-10]|jgi:hypothetical protein|nr:hypothetical protein [Oscillatoria princeps RMCB-10]
MSLRLIAIGPGKTRVLALASLSLLLGGLTAGAQMALFGASGATDIGEIQQKREVNSTVYVQGKVEKRAPFLGAGAYQLQDATGSIWVITNKTLPNQGDEVSIKGSVNYESIPVAGLEIGEVYIKEQEQLQRKPAPKSP